MNRSPYTSHLHRNGFDHRKGRRHGRAHFHRTSQFCRQRHNNSDSLRDLGALVFQSFNQSNNQSVKSINKSINQSIKIVKRCDKSYITKNKCRLQRFSVDLSLGWILLENSRLDYCTQIRLTLKDEKN